MTVPGITTLQEWNRNLPFETKQLRTLSATSFWVINTAGETPAVTVKTFTFLVRKLLGEKLFKLTHLFLFIRPGNGTCLGSSQTVTYSEAMQVKKASSGPSSRTWIIAGAAAAAAVIVGVIVLKPVLCDGGAQSRGPC